MGGHGGLNILPQKRWNVYNYENREKVLRDEEAAAREEQLKREEARKCEAEFRLDRLRRTRGLGPSGGDASSTLSPEEKSKSEAKPQPERRSNHINLFEGIRIFDPVDVNKIEAEDDKIGGNKRMKMMKKEAAAPKVVTAEDEKYRLGYGIVGKGVNLPWYMAKPGNNSSADGGRNLDSDDDVDIGAYKYRDRKEGVKVGGKKTLEELREERLKRETREKERERSLVIEKGRKSGFSSRYAGFSSRR